MCYRFLLTCAVVLAVARRQGSGYLPIPPIITALDPTSRPDISASVHNLDRDADNLHAKRPLHVNRHDLRRHHVHPGNSGLRVR